MGLLQRMRSATLGTQSCSNLADIDSASDPGAGGGKRQSPSKIGAQSYSRLDASNYTATKRGSDVANQTDHLTGSLSSGKTSRGKPRPTQSPPGSSSAGASSWTSRVSEAPSASQSVSTTSGRNRRRSSPSSITAMPLRNALPSAPTAVRHQEAVRQQEAFRQQEAAVRLSRGSAAHSLIASGRRKTSSSPSPTLPFAYHERPSGHSFPHCDRLPRARSAGSPARPIMAAICTGERAAGDMPRDSSPVHPHSSGGRSLPDNPASRSGPWPIAPGMQRRRPGPHTTKAVASKAKQHGSSRTVMSGIAMCPAPDSPLAALPQTLGLEHEAEHCAHATSSATPNSGDAAGDQAAFLPISCSNKYQAADEAKPMEAAHIATTGAIDSYPARGATEALACKPAKMLGTNASAADQSEVADAFDKWYALPPQSPAPLPLASLVIAPLTPSPLPLLPVAQQVNVGKSTPSGTHDSSLNDPYSLRVSIGPTIPAPNLLLPTAKYDDLAESDKDIDAMAGAKGPDTPQAHAESPFAKPAAQAATDTSSAATSGSASKASTTGVSKKMVSPPPPGPKVKPKKTEPPATPARSLFSCCSTIPAVKGESEPPVKLQSPGSKTPLQGPPPRTPIRTGHNRRLSSSSALSFGGSIDGSPIRASLTSGTSYPTLEHCSSIASHRSRRADRSLDGGCQSGASPVLRPMSPHQVLANFSNPAAGREGRKKTRQGRHRRSSSITSVSSLESYRSTTSLHSHLSQLSATSNRSRRPRNSADINTEDMQVKGIELMNMKGDSRRPLRSALRQSASPSSMDGSEFSSGYSDMAFTSAVTHMMEPAAFERRRNPSGADVLRSPSVISLHSLAEGADEGASGESASAAGGVSGGSVCSFDSTSSLVSASSGSLARSWHEVPVGMDRDSSFGGRSVGDFNRLGAMEGLRVPSGTWSASSSDKDSRTPSFSPPSFSTPDSKSRQPRRSESTELLADVEKAINASPMGRPPHNLQPIATSPPPADMLNSGGSTARSPASQLQQMHHLREKVHAMRAETECTLAAITALAADARARRSASPPVQAAPESPILPVVARAAANEGTRLQEQKAKLQRRLEQFSMQQMRLELHIKEVVESSSSPGRPSRTSDDAACPLRSRLSPLSVGQQQPNVRATNGMLLSEGTTPKGCRRRVTFGSPSPAPGLQTQDDSTYVNVVHTVAGLRSMVGPPQRRSVSNGSAAGVMQQQGDDTSPHNHRRTRSGRMPLDAAAVETKAHRSTSSGRHGTGPSLRPRSSSPPSRSAPSAHRRASSIVSDSSTRTRRKTSRDPNARNTLTPKAASPHFSSSSRGGATDLNHRRNYGGGSNNGSSSGGRSEITRPRWVDDAVIRSGGRAF